MFILRSIKFWLQRRLRGWDDSETWSLDYFYCEYLRDKLRNKIDWIQDGYGCSYDSANKTIEFLSLLERYIIQDSIVETKEQLENYRLIQNNLLDCLLDPLFFSDQEIKFLIPRLKRYCTLAKEIIDPGEQYWKDLDILIETLEKKLNNEPYKEENLKLFTKHFFSLWW